MIWQEITDGSGQAAETDSENSSFTGRLLQWGQDHSIRRLLPVLAWQQEGHGDMGLQEEVLEDWMPGYLYQTQTGQVAVHRAAEEPEGGEESELTLEQLMQQENQSYVHAEEEAEVVVLDLEGLMAENGWNGQDQGEEAPGLQGAEPDPEADAAQEVSAAESGFIPFHHETYLT